MSSAEAGSLTIVMADGTIHPIPQPRPVDLVKWERYARSRGIAGGVQDGSVEQIMYLAYAVLTRDLSPAPDFDTWCDQVEELRGGDAADPTSTPTEASGG